MSRLSLAVAAAVLLAATGCSGGDGSPTTAPTSVPPTPLASFDTTALTVARADFCARVAPAAVEDALGGAAASSRSWANGDRAKLADGVKDVAHEFGCRWRAPDGTTATAWVFAPPVTREQAGRLARAAVGDGCRAVPDAPRFGAPSAAVRCADGTTAYHGLFGDAWLSCAVTARGGADRDTVGRWCVAVAQAAAA